MTLLFSSVVSNFKWKIFWNFVFFSECPNFKSRRFFSNFVAFSESTNFMTETPQPRSNYCARPQRKGPTWTHGKVGKSGDKGIVVMWWAYSAHLPLIGIGLTYLPKLWCGRPSQPPHPPPTPTLLPRFQRPWWSHGKVRRRLSQARTYLLLCWFSTFFIC